MPILTPVPKLKRNARTADGIQAMIIEDACVFNLQALMLGLGLSEESTKRWVSRHGIRAATQGRTWVFTGEEFRQDLAAHSQKKLGARAASNRNG